MNRHSHCRRQPSRSHRLSRRFPVGNGTDEMLVCLGVPASRNSQGLPVSLASEGRSSGIRNPNFNRPQTLSPQSFSICPALLPGTGLTRFDHLALAIEVKCNLARNTLSVLVEKGLGSGESVTGFREIRLQADGFGEGLDGFV
jgi:hypothetical protein